MLDLPCDDVVSSALWNGLVELGDIAPGAWTLIGAQMVLLHGLESGRTPPRRSLDLDLVVNVRTVAGKPGAFGGLLSAIGYRLEGTDAMGKGHRFVQGEVKIDVLLPDGLGAKTPREFVPGVPSIEVPGGSQALRRSEPVDVRTDLREGVIWRPNLLGAILVKARAVAVDDLPDAQRQDLAFLLSLVEDPFELATRLKANERTWLRRMPELLNPAAAVWRVVEGADDAQTSLRVLAGL